MLDHEKIKLISVYEGDLLIVTTIQRCILVEKGRDVNNVISTSYQRCFMNVCFQRRSINVVLQMLNQS